ncbi:MAG: hypothetical protein H5T46_05575 [Archaeoglobi archaeon]|nr:hypothetical protein [Candidatus Mnemosynella sp.]
MKEADVVTIRMKERGRDDNEMPFTASFNMAKLVSENKLRVFSQRDRYFLIIDRFEIGLSLSALKEIVGLSLAMMPPEEVKKIMAEWVEG